MKGESAQLVLFFLCLNHFCLSMSGQQTAKTVHLFLAGHCDMPTPRHSEEKQL